MSEQKLYDISNLAFIYNNIVSYMNNICLDLDVVNKLGKLKAEGKINDDKKELYQFLERRTYLSLVVTLDFILDDTNTSREEITRIHNASLNIDKLLCVLQDCFRNEKDQVLQKGLNKDWNEIKKKYDTIQSLPERKKLATFRNKLAAHVDVSFIKKDLDEELDLSPKSYAKMVIPLCELINEIGSMIHYDDKASINPFGEKRCNTPIDNLF